MMVVRADDSEAIHSRAVAWRIRLDEGATPAERQEFEAWLAADARHRRVWEEYAALSRLAARLPRPERRHLRAGSGLRPVYATAVLVAVVGTGALLLAGQAGPTAIAAEVRNPGPSTRAIRFVDGTEALLDKDTLLLARFSVKERHVTLKAGRARFHSPLLPGRPFVLEGGEGRVLASDATFDASLTGRALRVAVIDGSAVLVTGDTDESLTLAGGQAGKVVDGLASPVSPPAVEDMRWPVSRISFDHAPLSEVVARANRFGTPVIVLEDERLGRRQVTGVFDLRDTRRLSRVLSAAIGLDVREDGARELTLQLEAPRSL